jgi:signal transduction histidine kinase
MCSSEHLQEGAPEYRARMGNDDTPVAPERAQTDESLRQERDESDREIADQQSTDATLDMLVHCARDTADTAVTAARGKTDQDPPHPQAADRGPGAAIVEERRVEDDALQQERASADEGRRRERAEHARTLSPLLPQQRDQTNQNLLTERNRSDEALAHRDDFLGIVSHDLRNLVTAIMMAAKRITTPDAEHEAGDQTVALDVATSINRYAARMKRLIGDIDDVANLNAGHLAFTPARRDATRLIVEAVETLQTAAAAKGIALATDIPDLPLWAEFDNDRLLQVLGNLIGNAVKFTADGGHIWVRGARAGNDIRLSVSDTGSGVPTAMLEAIFERFWQVGKDDRRGSGLGLYICKRLVEAHGGRIWAESTGAKGARSALRSPLRPEDGDFEQFLSAVSRR